MTTDSVKATGMNICYLGTCRHATDSHVQIKLRYGMSVN